MIKSRFLANASWMVGGKVFQMGISLVVGMLTARYLGSGNYGILNYTAAYVAFFTSLCTLGLNGILVKELVANPDKQGEILGTSIAMRLISSIISMGAIVLIVMMMDPNDPVTLTVAFLQSISLTLQAFDLINYWYQSMLRSKYVTIIQMISAVVIAGYKIVILVMGKDVKWFAFSVTLDSLLLAMLLVWSYFRNDGQKFTVSFKMAKLMLSQSYHFILSGVMVAVYGQIDKIMLSKMLGDSAVGLYSVAVFLAGVWVFIPLALIDSARPLIMEEKLKDKKKYIKQLKRLYAAIIWLSIVYGIFMTIFAKQIVLILYGEQFIGATSALVIVVWYCSFAYLGSAKNIWLICEGKSKYEKYFTLGGAVCNVALNFVLIPIMGIDGAAIATLITQIFTNVLLPFIIKDTRENAKYMFEALILKGVK